MAVSRRRFSKLVGAAVPISYLSAGRTAAGSARRQSSVDWPQHYNDPQNTGFVDGAAVLEESPNVDWSVDVSGGGAVTPNLVLYDGTIVFAPYPSDEVLAIDAETGETLWTKQVHVTNPLAVSGSTAYLPTDGVTAVSLADGSTRWETPTDRYAGGLTLSNGRVFQLSQHAVYAVDATSGELAWSFRADQGANGAVNGIAPAVSDDTVYSPSRDYTRIVALSAGKGEVVWETSSLPDGGYDTLYSPVVTNSSVLVQNLRRLYCIDRGTGDLRWELDPDGDVLSNPVTDGTAAYLTSDREGILRVDIETGTANVLLSGGNTGRLSVGESYLYVNEGRVNTCLDKESGEIQWRREKSGSDSLDDETPPVVGDRTMFFADDGAVTKLSARSDTPDPSSPDISTQRGEGEGTEAADSGGLPIFSQFRSSSTSLSIVGGMVAALAGGGYAAYRRFAGDESED